MSDIEPLEKDPKIAVIGCGHWGKNLIRNFAELGVLAGVSDVDAQTAARFSEQYNVPAVAPDAVADHPDFDSVVVASPAATHGELVIKALRAGKHVMVEKPLALYADDAEHAIEIAARQKRVLMVGHLLQYHPVFLELRKRVQDGQIGRLQYLYSNRISLGKIRREENIFWSFAPHDISMILSLAGELPNSVQATGANILHQQIYDMAHANMTFPSGVHAHVFVSWLNPFKEQKLVVAGEDGAFVFDDREDWDKKLVYYPHKIDWQGTVPAPIPADGESITVDQSEPLRDECQHFIDCVRDGKSARTDGHEGLRVLRVLDAAEKSLKIDDHVAVFSEQKGKYRKDVFVHESSYVDEGVDIGEGTKIWHFSHVLSNTRIGRNCVIGQNVMAGPNVSIGNRCKIQNNVSLFDGVELGDGVFCGPSCVFTNVNNPRAEVNRKDQFRKTKVGTGATIGANATIVCGHDLGEYCFIAAGAVVTRDVKPHALMAGVPAVRLGWMSHDGERLGEDMICPRSGRKYQETDDGNLIELKEQAA